MAVFSAVAAGVTAIAGIAGAYATKRAGDRQARAAKEANRLNRRIEDVRARRSRVQAARSQRIQSAAAQNAAAQSGGGLQSSTTQGAIAALTTQTNANIAFTNQLDALSQQVIQAQGEIDQAKVDARNATAIAGGVRTLATDAVNFRLAAT